MPAALLQPVMPNLARTSGNTEQLRDLWKLFSKVKDSMENGRRFENLSWRLWFKSNVNEDPSALAVYINKIGLSPDANASVASPTGAEEASQTLRTPLKAAQPEAPAAVHPRALFRVLDDSPTVSAKPAASAKPAVSQVYAAAVAQPSPSVPQLSQPAKPASRSSFFIEDSDDSDSDVDASSPKASKPTSPDPAPLTMLSRSDHKASVFSAAAKFTDGANAARTTRPRGGSNPVKPTHMRSHSVTAEPCFEKVAPVASRSSSSLSSLLQRSPLKQPSMTRSLSTSSPQAARSIGRPLDAPLSLRRDLAQERKPMRYWVGDCSDSDSAADSLESSQPPLW